MTARPAPGWVRPALEFGPTLVFFGLFGWLGSDEVTIAGRDMPGLIVAGVLFVPVLLAGMAALWWLDRRVSRMQVFAAVLVTALGGLTLWLNDERLFKVKTTVVYATFAVVLGAGLVMGRNGLRWLMSDTLPMKPQGWALLTRAAVGMCLFMAALNELVWRTQTTAVWVTVETFVFPLLVLAFFVWQTIRLAPYLQFFVPKPKHKRPGGARSQ